MSWGPARKRVIPRGAPTLALTNMHHERAVLLCLGERGNSLTTKWTEGQVDYAVRNHRASEDFLQVARPVMQTVLDYIGPGDHVLSPGIINQTYHYLTSETN